MKNLALLTIIVFLFFKGYSQIIPNNSFETWETFNNGTYEDPTPWNTANPYTSLAGKVTVTKSDDAETGNYSAHLETKEINFLTYTFYAPGVLTFADFNIDFFNQTYSFGGGLPLKKKVSGLNGKYKYTPVENDSASVLIYCFRHPEGEAIDTIGVGLTFLHDTENWTDFSVNMQYFNNHIPDTFNVLIMSTGTFQLGYMPPGSVMFVDDITVDTTFDAIETNAALQAKLYPNPTSGKLFIELNEDTHKGLFAIYDINGKKMMENEFKNALISTDVSSLPGGIYTYQIKIPDKIPVNGTFVKR